MDTFLLIGPGGILRPAVNILLAAALRDLSVLGSEVSRRILLSSWFTEGTTELLN